MIVILCGPPGAGKTTLATGLAERLRARGMAIEVVHSDEFARRTYERMYERVASEGGSEGEGRNWLLDGTFHRREWRERFRGLDEVFVVYVTASLESCLERDREREDSIGETGVHVVYREFERPRAELTLDTDELSVEEALDQLERTIEGRR